MQDESRDNTVLPSDRKALRGASVVALSTVLFGLYTFVLMSTGVQGDTALASNDFNELLYNAREGLLLAGFVLYGLVAWRRPGVLSGRKARIRRALLAAMYTVCALIMLTVQQGIPLIASVLAMAFLAGFAGGAVYEKVALTAQGLSTAGPIAPDGRGGGRHQRDGATRILGVIVGIGGAIAMLTQYLLQLVLSLGGWFVVLLAICFCLVAYLLGALSQEAPHKRTEVGGPMPAMTSSASGRRRTLYLIVVVACLFALFPFFEVVVRDAFSWTVFYQWHRLFAIVGYLVIGAAAFFGGRTATSLVIAVAALFTTFVMTQTALMQVDSLLMALFYVLLGAAIAYSGISFMSLAPHTAHPAPVASAGRMLEGAVTIAGGAISLIGGWAVSAVLLIALALIAVMIVFMVRGGFFTHPANADAQKPIQDAEGESSADGKRPPNDEEKPGAGESIAGADNPQANTPDLTPISERYGLTRRETEVLGLVLRDLTTQQMADELVVTKSTVKFHVTNILKKTDAQTRQQLIEKLSEETKPDAGLCQ